MEIKEIETVPGFDIPLRELNEEEATREITLERFQEWHGEVGEDFADQVGGHFNEKIFGGYLLHKYPERNEEILDCLNSKYSELLSLQDTYENEDGSDDEFYADFAEFLNLTKHAKKRANQILIQVMEYYGR